MRAVRKLFLRVRSLFRREQLDDQLSDEFAFHLAEQKAELMDQGMSEREAEREARRLFGPLLPLREQCRETRRTQWLEDIALDTQFTLRSLRASKSFSVIAILTLALGIGANTAFFSTAYGILFRPLPYPQPEQLVDVVDGPSGIGPVTALRSLAKAADYAGYFPPEPANLQLPGESVRVYASRVSFNLAPVLGVRPQFGRWFRAAEERAAAPVPVVLSHQYWRTRFAADPAILHKQILLDEKLHQIIGVMPASFSFPSPQTEIWLPIDTDPRLAGQLWGNGGFRTIGRLGPHATLASAQSEIRPLAAVIRGQFPWPMPDAWGASAAVVRFDQAQSAAVRPKLLVLAAATLLLLLMACSNVGNMLLARGVQRHREFALREALGASRTRLLRQLLTENFILVLLGGAAGLLAAFAIAGSLPRLFPRDTPRLAELVADPTLLLGAATSLLLTVLLFTAAPLLAARLKDSFSGRSLSPSRRSAQLSLALIGGELALATTLLIGASLMGHTLWQLSTADPGFAASQVVSARLSAGPSRCPDRARCLALLDEISQTLLAQPGTRAVNWTNAAPLEKEFAAAASELEDHPRSPREPASVLWQTTVTPGFFRTLGIPLLAGRAFTEADREGAALVTLISRSTARRFWPGQSPIGKKIRSLADLQWRTVVGVVGDVAQYSITGFPPWVDGVQYLPLPQTSFDAKQSLHLSLLLETANPDWPLALKQRYPDIVVANRQTLGELRAASVADQRSTATLLTLFAALGLLLGIAGVHGVVSHRAAQRTKELGIRLALGATPWQLMQTVMQETVLVALAGAGLGVVVAQYASGLLRSLIYGISVHDPLSFAVSPLALLAAAVLAAAIPALRATRTDPVITLRQD
jgi:predicted permease